MTSGDPRTLIKGRRTPARPNRPQGSTATFNERPVYVTTVGPFDREPKMNIGARRRWRPSTSRAPTAWRRCSRALARCPLACPPTRPARSARRTPRPTRRTTWRWNCRAPFSMNAPTLWTLSCARSRHTRPRRVNTTRCGMVSHSNTLRA